MPTISIIVPVYNVQQYIRDCIESVLKQTRSDFELILVDDGSPDKSGDICDEYAEMDARIRVIHQENGGLSVARNRGLDICSGSYVTFLDSDDMLHPQALELMIDCAKNTGADVTIFQYDNDYETVFSRQYDTEQAVETIDGVEACWRLSGVKNGERGFEGSKRIAYIIACAKMISRRIAQEIRFPERRAHEDEYTVFRYYLEADMIAILQPKLYFYRPNPTSITSTPSLESNKNRIDGFNCRIKYFKKHHMGDLERQTVSQRSWFLNEYAIYSKAQGKKTIFLRINESQFLLPYTRCGKMLLQIVS